MPDLPFPLASDAYLLPATEKRALAGRGEAAKRAEDLVLATLALLLFALPMLLIALAVRLDSPGPVLFRQRRTGHQGASFQMLKFRTMRFDPEQTAALAQATRADPRVTPLGAMLRRTSLDELPQLLNVLRGDMSLVGPRPHAPATRAAGGGYSTRSSPPTRPVTASARA